MWRIVATRIALCARCCTRYATGSPVNVAAQLAARLPTLIRGVYYKDWDPSRTPLAIHEVDAFLSESRTRGVWLARPRRRLL